MLNDRQLRWAAMGLALLLLPDPAAAQVGPALTVGEPEVMRPLTVQAVTEEDLIASLEQEGFSVVERERTFLGRVRILAVGPEGTREVILNPRNGKVLRDLFRRQEPLPAPPETLPEAPEEAPAAEATKSLEAPAAADNGAPGGAPGQGHDGNGSRSRDEGGGRGGQSDSGR